MYQYSVRVVQMIMVVVALCVVAPTPAVHVPEPTSVATVDVTPVPAPKPKPPKRPTSSVLCLAQNIFYEASNQPLEGVEAVAATVFNRMASDSWPNSVCAVVYQYRQFSWTLDWSKWSRRPPQKFMELAKVYLDQREVLMAVYPVTHFHRVDISPRWAPTLTPVATYGEHIFYALPVGEPSGM